MQKSVELCQNDICTKELQHIVIVWILPIKHDIIKTRWEVHLYREGNTRTVITFCGQFVESKGFYIDSELNIC